MATVEFSDVFVAHFRQRANRRIKRLYRDRLALFVKNPHDASLRNHALAHQWTGYHSFSLTDDRGPDDYRVIFRKTREGYVFVDFGTHDQLYRPWRRRSE